MSREDGPTRFGERMLDSLALLIVALAGACFVALSVLSVSAPATASGFLMGFATSAAAHYTELLIRVVVGLAFIANAASAPVPLPFAVFGWLLVGTSAALFMVPWRWHRAFAQRAVPWAVRHLRLVALVSFALGSFVIWSVVQSAA